MHVTRPASRVGVRGAELAPLRFPDADPVTHIWAWYRGTHRSTGAAMTHVVCEVLLRSAFLHPSCAFWRPGGSGVSSSGDLDPGELTAAHNILTAFTPKFTPARPRGEDRPDTSPKPHARPGCALARLESHIGRVGSTIGLCGLTLVGGTAGSPRQARRQSLRLEGFISGAGFFYEAHGVVEAWPCSVERDQSNHGAGPGYCMCIEQVCSGMNASLHSICAGLGHPLPVRCVLASRGFERRCSGHFTAWPIAQEGRTRSESRPRSAA